MTFYDYFINLRREYDRRFINIKKATNGEIRNVYCGRSTTNRTRTIISSIAVRRSQKIIDLTDEITDSEHSELFNKHYMVLFYLAYSNKVMFRVD